MVCHKSAQSGFVVVLSRMGRLCRSCTLKLDRFGCSPAAKASYALSLQLHAIAMSRSSVKRFLRRAAQPANAPLSPLSPPVVAASPRASTSRNTIEYELQTLAQQQRIFQAYLQYNPTQLHQLSQSRRLSTSAKASRGRTVRQVEDAAESGGPPQHVSEQLLRKSAESPPNYGESSCSVRTLLAAEK